MRNHCSSFALPSPSSRGRPRLEIDDPDFASLIAAEDPFGPQPQMFGFEYFCIPKFSGARNVSLAWESYLRLTLMKSPATEQEVRWKAPPEAHLFLFPPNTGSISLGLTKSFSEIPTANNIPKLLAAKVAADALEKGGQAKNFSSVKRLLCISDLGSTRDSADDEGSLR
jgi:hypothetical protein